MIDLKGTEIKYGDFVAMHELDLHIREGEFFTLLGPSGCGKTSLLRMITGFIEPSQGQIYIKERDVTDVSVEKRGVGIVFQSYAIFPTMNVFENIAFGLRVQRLSPNEIEEMVLEMAKMVDLSREQLYRKASELSGGQQQRVAIARALILKPDILCLDEPLSNLDAKLRGQLRLELKKLQKRFGITTIYVTHDQEEALTLSDRIAVFDHGVLEQVGSPEEIFRRPATPFVANFIGDINQYATESLHDVFGIEAASGELGVSFIRLNNVKTEERSGMIKVPVTVVDIDFHGFFVKYTFVTGGGHEIRSATLHESEMHAVNDRLDIFVNEKDFFHL